MKTTFFKLITTSVLFSLLILSGCKKFLDIVPKDGKIPTTFADYEAFMRDEYNNHVADVSQAILLLNDRFELQADLSYYRLNAANYNWDENANRILLNNADESAYYNSYRTINTCNLLIENVNKATEATSAQKMELIAQAKVLRAIAYYIVANYYGDTYQSINAATKLSVPLITSADVNAPNKQVSIEEIYNFMLKDIEEAIPALNVSSATVLHPNKGAAYALRARIYLTMSRYQEALVASNEALKINSQLFDWTAYYAQHKNEIEQVDPVDHTPVYNRNQSPMDFNFVENYYFRHGLSDRFRSESPIRIDRAAKFEPGDALFASRWRLRTIGSETYYYSITNGFYNHGGLTTTEVYLIKAECQARLNDVTGALKTLDEVRVKRIFPQQFSSSSASSVIAAVKLIQQTKSNDLILGIVPFADRRRLNKDSDYATTLSKVVDGQMRTLSPTSHLWTMPFPQGAIKNPGNGTIQQNVNQ